MLTFTRESSSESQTLAIAGEVARCLRPRDVVALDGALGAGKTCFVRGLVAGLGGDPRHVSSPTFVLHQEYEVGNWDKGPEASRQQGGALSPQSSVLSPRAGRERASEIARVVHIDAYRMSGASDLESIGWDELLEADDLVIAIEWPTKVPQDALPRLRTIRIQFEVGWHGSPSRVGSPRLSEPEDPRRTCGSESRKDHDRSETCPTSPMRRLSFAIPTVIEERFTSLVRQTRQCRTCSGEITADNPFFPFCSERCKLADLGAWFSEKYTITRPLDQRDLEEG